jgi:UDPglucose--hexose-1-phosphate uridylyltransferase
MLEHSLPHRRLNPLTGDWILVSPQRTQRPWRGQVEKLPQLDLPDYDPNCYLCPGNARSGGKRNPNYPSTYVFDNDFPALLPIEVEDFPIEKGAQGRGEMDYSPKSQDLPPDLFLAEGEPGICRVVCFSPLHNASLPDLPAEQIEAVIDTWIDQSLALEKRGFVHYVQVFENKGAMMGASNPHPHCQIWATAHIPNEPAKELSSQKEYYTHNKTCLLCDYLQAETRVQDRVVLKNEHFTALVPFWAVWPFEVMLLVHRHVPSLRDLARSEVAALADILHRLTTRYDNMFGISFPYSMGFHQAPVNDGPYPEWHLHAHFYPPLLRSASVRKFMVGFEMLASPQRDLTPEQAAERLRSLGDVLNRKSG